MSVPFVRRPAFASLIVFALAATGHARDTHRASLTISAAWARPTPPSAPSGAGYLTIVNGGDAADRLVGGSSPAVREVQVHEMRFENGIARMNAVAGGLVIPAHGRVTLAPGGYHVMLIGPKQRFVVGRRVPATLRFEHAGAIKVSFAVRPTAPAEAK